MAQKNNSLKMNLYNHSREVLKCFIIYLCISEAVDLRHSLHEARIFKIIEKDGQIMLEKQNVSGLDNMRLSDYLKNNAQIEYRVNNILNRNPKVIPASLKKNLVKRLVPHGETIPDIVQDARDNVFYKPLFRVHKTNGFKDLLQDVKGSQNNLGQSLNVSQKLLSIQRDDSGGKSKQQLINSSLQLAAKHIIEVDGLISKLASPEERKMYQHVLQNLLNDLEAIRNDVLRSLAAFRPRAHGDPRSSEATPPPSYALMPGVTILISQDNDDQITQNPLNNKYHLPLWNYWNYQKTVVQDECPGEQVKVGNVCIKTPPH